MLTLGAGEGDTDSVPVALLQPVAEKLAKTQAEALGVAVEVPHSVGVALAVLQALSAWARSTLSPSGSPSP